MPWLQAICATVCRTQYQRVMKEVEHLKTTSQLGSSMFWSCVRKACTCSCTPPVKQSIMQPASHTALPRQPGATRCWLSAESQSACIKWPDAYIEEKGKRGAHLAQQLHSAGNLGVAGHRDAHHHRVRSPQLQRLLRACAHTSVPQHTQAKLCKYNVPASCYVAKSRYSRQPARAATEETCPQPTRQTHSLPAKA